MINTREIQEIYNFCMFITFTIFVLISSKLPAVDTVTNFLTDNCGEIDPNFSQDAQGIAPWIVAITLTKDEQLQEFLQTGVLIRPSIVITAFPIDSQGLIIDDQEKFINASRLMVQAGAGEFQTNPASHSRIQLSKVDMIVPEKSATNPGVKLFLVHLKEPLNVTSPWTRPICLPFYYFLPALQAQHKAQDYFTSYGYENPFLSHDAKSPDLIFQILRSQSQEECGKRYENIDRSRSLPPGITCASKAFASDKECLSRGSMTYFFLDQRQYLTSIAAVVASTACSDNNTYFFHNLVKPDLAFQNWLINGVKCLDIGKIPCNSGRCVPFSKVCDGQPDCSEAPPEDENLAICHFRSQFGIFSCDGTSQKISMLKVCDGQADCRNGADETLQRCQGDFNVAKGIVAESPTMPAKELKGMKDEGAFCQILQYPPSVATKCRKDGLEVSCQRASVGSTLELRCKKFHHSTSRMSSIQMTCSPHRVWTPFKPFFCKAECGRLGSNRRNFERASPILPWFVSLFYWNSDTREYDYICGASLVDHNVVITAGQCVVEADGAERERRRMLAVLGPKSNVFQLNSPQTSVEVREFYVPITYNSYSLSSDLAIFKLKEWVEFTEDIQPICFLPRNPSPLPAGISGLLPQLRSDISGAQHVRSEEIFVLPSTSCSRSLEMDVGANEFCGGRNPNASTNAECTGDVGSGLIFRESSSNAQTSPYYLTGVLSRGLNNGDRSRCRNVGIFTHVDTFGPWILDTLLKIHEELRPLQDQEMDETEIPL